MLIRSLQAALEDGGEGEVMVGGFGGTGCVGETFWERFTGVYVCSSTSGAHVLRKVCAGHTWVNWNLGFRLGLGYGGSTRLGRRAFGLLCMSN